MSPAVAAIRLLGALLRRCSLETAGRFGRALGALAWALDGRHRAVAMRNLERAFPGRSSTWRSRTARASFAQAGATMTELLWSPALVRAALDASGRVEGLDHLARAVEAGRGALLASAHYGNWELMGIELGRRGFPLHVIARPLEHAGLDAELRELRSTTGNRVVSKHDAVRGSLRALRDGGVVAVLNDQNTLRGDAVFVPYFGVQAGTAPLVAILHLRTGAPVLPAFAVPSSSGYRFVIESPLAAPDGGDPDTRIEALTAEITARVERRVRAVPQAWLWMHDRWRTRPRGNEVER